MISVLFFVKATQTTMAIPVWPTLPPEHTDRNKESRCVLPLKRTAQGHKSQCEGQSYEKVLG